MKKRTVPCLLIISILFALMTTATAWAADGTNGTYYAASAEEFSTAVQSIAADASGRTDFTIVVTADVDAGSFAGVAGKHVTLKSTEGKAFTLSGMGTSLEGGLTLDNVKAFGSGSSSIYANGHLFETTENYHAIPSSLHPDQGVISKLYGGGREKDVTGDTNLILRGNVRFEFIFGGGLDSAVTGSTHILIDSPATWAGNVFGGGHGVTTTSGTVGGSTYVTVRRGQVGSLYGGGRNGNTGALDNKEIARVFGDTYVAAGDENAAGYQAYIGTSMASCAGSWYSTVTNTHFTVLPGTVTYGVKGDGSYNGGTTAIFGAGVNDLVLGTVSIQIHAGSLAEQVYGAGYNESGTIAGCETQILNQSNAPYAVHIVYNEDGTVDQSDSSHGLNAGSDDEIPTTINGDVLIEVGSGNLDFVVLDNKKFSVTGFPKLTYCTINGNATIAVTGGRVAQVQGNKKHYIDGGEYASSVTYDGCGTETDPTQIGYMYYFEDVTLQNGAQVDVDSDLFKQFQQYEEKVQKPFFSVKNLHINSGSKLTTRSNEGDGRTNLYTQLYGNVTMDTGTWHAKGYTYVYEALESKDSYLQFDNAFAIGYNHREDNAPPAVFSSTRDTFIGCTLGWTLQFYGSVALDDCDISLMGRTNVRGNWNGGNSLLRLPVIGEGQNYPTGSIPLNIDGTATGSCEVLVVTADNNKGWETVQTPAVGQNYITGYKAGAASDGIFYLANTEPAAAGLFLWRTEDLEVDDYSYYMWQIATGRTVTFDQNGGDTEAFPQKIGLLVNAPGEIYTVGSLPAPPARAGYTFTGWNTQRDGSGTAFYANTPVTESITVYAQWSRNGSSGGGTTYYTLRYESNGGTEYGAESYAGSTVVTLDKTPSREGCTFTGWYEDEALKKRITEIRMTSDKTVYAGWKTTGVPEWLNGEDHFAYVVGYEDGTVRPLANITRAEAATIFFRLLKEEVRDQNLTPANSFTDVAEGTWCSKPISTMAALGIVNGRENGRFAPDAPITRAEFAAICARFDGGRTEGGNSFTDISGHWAEEEIERAASLGWILGYEDGAFRPDACITRAEAMTMINRVLLRIPETRDDLLHGMNVWPDNAEGSWYYLAVQEATNSHHFERKGGNNERWTELTAGPDWSLYQ